MGPGEDGNGNGNGVLDGDHAVWTGAGWSFTHVFTPHDLDNDGRVECGGPEYTRDQVTRFVVTHEMGHAVGIDYDPTGHCDTPGCVMYQLTDFGAVAWFCDRCEALILVHNN